MTRRLTCAWTRVKSSRHARSSPPGTSAGWLGSCASSARSATPLRSPARSCALAHGLRSRRRSRSSRSSAPRFPPLLGLPPGTRQAYVSGPANRRQRRAGPARSGVAACLGTAARGRRACRDLLSLARGQACEALSRRARAWLHLPARPARVWLRARARGGIAHTRVDRALGRRDGTQPARLLGASACGHEACRSLNRSRRSSMTPPATARSLPKRAAPRSKRPASRRVASRQTPIRSQRSRSLGLAGRGGCDPGARCRATAGAPGATELTLA